MSEVKLTDRVSIDNLVGWNVGFRATEAEKDITIPKNVKGYKQLTVAEIDGQVKNGNKFFVGTDGFGNNADIKINDKNVIDFVFGIEEVNGTKPSSILLDKESVSKLLKVSGKAKFESELKKVVVTETEKRMIVPLAREIGIDKVETYKIVAIEKISGYKFD